MGLIISGCTPETNCELLIRNASIIDGSGSPAYTGDIAINADTIAAMGTLTNYKGNVEIDATGLKAAPGFINMLSWANRGREIPGGYQTRCNPGGDGRRHVYGAAV